MLAIDVAQLVINTNCIKKVLPLKIQGVRAPLAHPPKSVAAIDIWNKSLDQFLYDQNIDSFEYKFLKSYLFIFTFTFAYIDIPLREKCPNTEFFLVCIFTYLLRKFPYSIRIWENTDQKKLRIWTLFKQRHSLIFPFR